MKRNNILRIYINFLRDLSLRKLVEERGNNIFLNTISLYLYILLNISKYAYDIFDADDAEPTEISQIPQWQTHRQSDPQEAPRLARQQSAATELCDHATVMTSHSLRTSTHITFLQTEPGQP